MLATRLFCYEWVDQFRTHLSTPAKQSKLWHQIASGSHQNLNSNCLLLCCNSWSWKVSYFSRSVLRTRLISVSIFCYWTKLFRVFNSTLKLLHGLLQAMKFMEFFGVESRTENGQDFSKKSQKQLLLMFLDTGTLEHLRNSHAAHTARETAREKIKVILRTEICGFFWWMCGLWAC